MVNIKQGNLRRFTYKEPVQKCAEHRERTKECKRRADTNRDCPYPRPRKMGRNYQKPQGQGLGAGGWAPPREGFVLVSFPPLQQKICKKANLEGAEVVFAHSFRNLGPHLDDSALRLCEAKPHVDSVLEKNLMIWGWLRSKERRDQSTNIPNKDRSPVT